MSRQCDMAARPSAFPLRSIPCPEWLRRLVELNNPFTGTSRASAIVDYLGLMPGMVVLGAGCGPGRVNVPAAEKVGHQGKSRGSQRKQSVRLTRALDRVAPSLPLRNAALSIGYRNVGRSR